jgi:CRISPR-associated endonuclease/helicase Cas3
VLRRKDLLDLFDTTPDLMGNDLDVSRFVRSSQSMDVFAFWRDIDGSPSAEMPPPVAEELCSVPISGMKAYLQENRRGPGTP